MTTMSPMLDAVAHPVVTVAHHVRTTLATLAVSVAALLLAVFVFDHVPGVRAAAPDVASLSAPVQRTIAVQEARGYACSTSPARTDAVVVEADEGSVAVLTLAAALDVTAARTGTIRAYCV